VSIRQTPEGVRVRLAPRKLLDPRFTYRLRDVPAASHPTVAAALVRASRPRPEDVVWDSFVGSGSELVERARAGAYRKLLGSDLEADALEASRANFAAAGLTDVALDLGDATLHAPPGVTCILTNPPMGRRVARDGSLGELLDRFTDHVAQILPSGGRLVWLSPFAGRTAARAEENQLRVTLRQTVDLGGFHAELQVWEKG
jgi:tRNA G10  N-methylase Trm11